MRIGGQLGGEDRWAARVGRLICGSSEHRVKIWPRAQGECKRASGFARQG